MAAIISISSDEEQPDESAQNPQKRRKYTNVDSVICLDDDDDKKCEVKKVTEDIILESDEDTFDKNEKKEIKHAQSNKVKEVDGNKFTEDIIVESDEDTFDKNENKEIKHTQSNKVQEVDGNKSSTSINGDLAITKEFEDTPENDIDKMFKDSKEMQTFINLCLLKIENEQTKSTFKTKIPHCKKLYDKVSTEYKQSEEFKQLLEEKINLSKNSSITAISSFNDIYQTLKLKINSQKTSNEITNRNEKIIAKLEHTFRKVQSIIAKLEVAEINFDEEEDSSYIQLQRYKERAVKIHEKICKYKKEDALQNHYLYTRLDFSGSNYPEINHAINKKFKKNFEFPTYFDVEKCIKKTVKEKNINLSEIKLKEEARDCFKKLGELLQKRRKLDLLNVHSQYLTMNNDPADEDLELDSKLKANFKEANSKINEIVAKYTKLQDDGEERKVSSDSDDSKKQTTDDEDSE